MEVITKSTIMKLGQEMTKEEHALTLLAQAIEDGRVTGVVADVQNILLEEEVKTEETGEQSQPEAEQVGEAAEVKEEGQPEGQTEGQEESATTGDQAIAEGEANGEANPAQSVE